MRNNAPAKESPAPALQRGLAALTALGNNEALTLDDLSKIVNCPKASMLRLLETLIQGGHVERREDKTYRALSMLMPRSDGSLTPLIARILDDISAETGATAEWYVPIEGAAVITQRSEPDQVVSVKAQIGFHRHLDGELEAVASVLAASVAAEPDPAWWWYDDQGGQLHPPATEVTAHLQQVAASRHCVYDHYNSNGIRRMAHAVVSEAGRLIGVLALAETFTPQANARRPENLQVLIKTAEKLMNIHKES